MHMCTAITATDKPMMVLNDNGKQQQQQPY